MTAVAVLVTLCASVLGRPGAQAQPDVAAFLPRDGAYALLAEVGGSDVLAAEWSRIDSASLLESGPEPFGAWVSVANTDVFKASYARLTTALRDPSSRTDRLLRVTDEGVRTDVVATTSEAVAYVPGKLTLPATLTPGMSWASQGRRLPYTSARYEAGEPYSTEAHAETATDPALAAQGCLDVSESEQVGASTTTTASTWCPGEGVVAWQEGSVSFRLTATTPEAATPDLTASFDWADLERLTWSTQTLRPGGMSVVAQSPVVAPGLLPDGTLVFAQRTSRDVVAVQPTRTGDITLWRGHPGGDLSSSATLGNLTVVVTTRREAVAYGSDGRRLWSVDLPDIARTPPTLAGDAVLVTTIDGTLTAVDPATGTVRWTYRTKGELRVPPVVAGDAVVVADQSGRLVRLDLRGVEVWGIDHVKPDALAVVAGTIVVTPHAASLVSAFRLDDGAPAWRLRPESAFTGLVGLDSVVVARTADGLRGIDPATGAERWRYAVATVELAGGGDRVVVVTDTDLLALDASGAELLRRPHGLGGLAQATVYLSSGPGTLVICTPWTALVGRLP